MAVIDKDLIKKYHLEEAQKRFQQISEYTFITKPMLAEEGDDDQQNQQNDANGQQMPPMQQQGNMGGNMNGQNGEQGNMPTSDNGQQGDANNIPPQNVPAPEGQNMDVDFEVDDAQPNGDSNVDTMQDGDEVIDVDELTNAQETTDVKIDGVNDKLQNLLAVTTKFIAAVDQNNKKIDDLRAEFEKRNPSEEEKINIRSQASAPYSETPKGYWDKKTQDSNYNIIYNNDVDPDKEEKEYVIKRSDINGNDDRSLSKSLDYPTKLKDFLDF